MPAPSLRGGPLPSSRGGETPPLPPLPLPSRLTVSFFPDVFDQRPIPRSLSWETLVERLSRFPVRAEITDKRQLPCWAPVRFQRDGATADDVIAVSCLVLDFDGGMEITEALDRCASFTLALHTSWSHRSQAPCFRLVLPLARPVPGPRWGEAWSLAIQALGLLVDRACSNANRRYLLPARPREEAPVVAEARTTDLALDLLPLLPAPADSSAVPRRRVVVPLHRVDRAVNRRLALDPAARRRLADSVGAVVRGSGRSERADGVPCPGCGRRSAWFLIAPERATRARCKHLNSCGWTGPVTELLGRAA